MSLIQAIEDDIRAVAGVVDGHVHDVLTKHLTLDNLALHLADGLTELAKSPLVAVAAGAAGLSPQQEQEVAEFISSVGGWLGKEAGPDAPPAA